MKEFQSDIEKLEQIVQELEQGKLTLDLALSKFEMGVKLYKKCQKNLLQVDKKIKILTDQLQNVEEDFTLITSEEHE